ncbi:MAG: ATPase, T2SS/T4P/T4SS family [Desulfosalsimonadaceae bacterium]
MGLKHSALREPVSSGSPEIDEVLGGGYRRASSILVTGGAGTGKTTLLSTFVEAACRRGEKVLFVNFEESAEAMMSAMSSINIDLDSFFRDGTLQMITAMPESMGAEEHFFRVFQAIDQFVPDHVLVDAVSATLRISTPQAAFEYMMRLVNICKERSITTLMSNQWGGSAINIEQSSNLGISSLVDALLLLRYVPKGAEIGRLLVVVKSRGMAHSNQYHEFKITDQGIVLQGPFEEGEHPGSDLKGGQGPPAFHLRTWESK